jgi:predicted protein tyrosine phosphatase
MRLRNKIGDNELVDQIQAAYMEKYENVERRAKAFARKILEKYGMTNQPFSQLLVKATKYAQKYELSDAEMGAFKRILEMELAGAGRGDMPKVTTNMSKVLGDITVDTKGFGMKVSDADYRHLQDILKMRDETRALHSQVVLQSLSYNDCDETAVSGQFRPENGHNKACHVHPVIAALFLPKMDIVEQHFLYSNLANIVASRHAQEPFKTRPDYELFYNLVTDPNDVVCDSRSPLGDLKNRCHLQKQLWQSVLALRNGQYYQCDQLDLMRAIDMCRLNKYDTPDLVYGRYDGTVIKRLFAAFSFRPTVVLSVPTPQVMSINPYFQTAHPVVSSISMINLRLPEYSNKYMTGVAPGGMTVGMTDPTATGPIKLSDAVQQAQLFFENGSLLMKQTQVIFSRGIITFFVDRRKHKLDLAKLTNPANMVGLPSAISGFERINTTRLDNECTDPIILDQSGIRNTNIASDPDAGVAFRLRSVVCAKVAGTAGTTVGSDDVSDLFVGSKTYVRCPVTERAPEVVNTYDPMSVSTTGTTPINTEDTNLASKDDIKTHGVIFVFEKSLSTLSASKFSRAADRARVRAALPPEDREALDRAALDRDILEAREALEALQAREARARRS